MRKEEFFEILGDLDDDIVKEAKTSVKRKRYWKVWGTIAACLGFMAVFGYAILQNDDFIVRLDSGDTVCFAKSGAVAGDLSLTNVASRELTAGETRAVFGDLPVTANATFTETGNRLLGFEGKIETIKMVINTTDQQLLDTVLVGSEKVTVVDGIPVTAGYFLTKPNSKGIRTMILYASFELGECVVYLENAGQENKRDVIGKELVTAIQSLIHNGKLDLSQIQK